MPNSVSISCWLTIQSMLYQNFSFLFLLTALGELETTQLWIDSNRIHSLFKCQQYSLHWIPVFVCLLSSVNRMQGVSSWIFALMLTGICEDEKPLTVCVTQSRG